MLVVMIGIRKSLDCVFTRRELKILDDVMPEMTRRAAADDMKDLESASGEVGLIQRLRIFCLGTKAAANASQLSRSRSSSSSSREKEHPELRVTFNVTPAASTPQNQDHQVVAGSFPNSHPVQIHSIVETINHESRVPLLISSTVDD